MSVPTFYSYFDADCQRVEKGNNGMFSWKQPRTDAEIKNEALGAIFKLAQLAQTGQRSPEELKKITKVGVNTSEPLPIEELVNHVKSGDYTIGCVRNYGERYKYENPEGDAMRDVIAPIFPQFNVQG